MVHRRTASENASCLRLSQPSVFAYAICLFVVMVNGHSKNEDKNTKLLYHSGTNKCLAVSNEGRVNIQHCNKTVQNQLLTFCGTNYKNEKNVVVILYSNSTQRYLCHLKSGKIVAKRFVRRNKANCMFVEDMHGGYSTYRLLERTNRHPFMCFTKRGHQITNSRKNDMCDQKFIPWQPQMNIPCETITSGLENKKSRHNPKKKKQHTANRHNTVIPK